MIELSPASILGNESIVYVCPQSMVTGIEVAEAGDDVETPAFPDGEAILALLDGVPISEHKELANRLIVDDIFSLEEDLCRSSPREWRLLSSRPPNCRFDF
jgi:hypothetical protein